MHSEKVQSVVLEKRQVEILRFAQNDNQSSVILNAVKDLALTGKLHIDLCRSSLYRLISDAIDWRIMSKEVRFIDTTVRDGNQSLWALNMKIGAMLPALPHMDEAGFESMEFFLSVIFKKYVREHKENPWYWLKEGTKRIKKTRLRYHGGMHSAFEKTPSQRRAMAKASIAS